MRPIKTMRVRHPNVAQFATLGWVSKAPQFRGPQRARVWRDAVEVRVRPLSAHLGLHHIATSSEPAQALAAPSPAN